jgi:hypothetical protein
MKLRALTMSLAVGAALLFGATGALANRCPLDMKKIDAALAKNPKLSDAQMAEVKRLRADGEQLHNAGNHPASEAALAKAMKILGI